MASITCTLTKGGITSELNVIQAAYDNRDNNLVFLEGIATRNHIKQMKHDINLSSTLNIRGKVNLNTISKGYDIYTSSISGTEYSEIVAVRKDEITKQSNNQEIMNGYVFYEIDKNQDDSVSKADEKLADGFYDKMYKMSPAPIKKEWIPTLMKSFIDTGFMRSMRVISIKGDVAFEAYKFNIPVEILINTIKSNIEKGIFKIDENANNTSRIMNDIGGLDGYLNSFGTILAERIKDSFTPQFVPETDKISDSLKTLTEYAEYRGKLRYFEAQKGLIMAASNALNTQNSVYIVSECGSGKTDIAIATALEQNKGKKFMNNVILCPGHLVEKWKREIERVSPMHEAVIISDFSDLMSLVPRVKDKNRHSHLWLVISQSVAKFGWEERPQAVWRYSAQDKSSSTSNASHVHAPDEDGCYCCPNCGKPLYINVWVGSGRQRHQERQYFGTTSFNHKLSQNSVCQECGTKLWGPVIKEDDPEWIRLGNKVGWIQRKRMRWLYQSINYRSNTRTLKQEESKQLIAINDAMEGELPSQIAPRKYPIARYIRKYLKGYIDYFCADEVQTLKGKDSLQGNAFGDLIKASRKTICLTGTLLNGYASGIFYMLYRTCPKLMRNEGFTYSTEGENEFTKLYGVYKSVSKYDFRNGREGAKIGPTKEKALPGVSPLVFTKFLLENAVFMSLEDISNGLPGYEEIPVPVTMSPELKSAYDALYNDIQREFRHRSFAGGTGSSMRIMGQVFQMLNVYPDQPYNQLPIVDPFTGEIISTPESLDHAALFPKEQSFINLVERKIVEGEKILVYYNFTNRTDVSQKLPRLLEERGIKTASLTTSVKSEEREKWIADKVNEGIQVLFTNPTLVETGLDLLDFTTIIYYQLGYNLFTMRQASRRSWRLNQDKDIQVYFMYYADTVQEQALSLMATKLQASLSIEGKFCEEGLAAMSDNEDVLTQIAANVTEGIKTTVDATVFNQSKKISGKGAITEVKSANIKPLYEFTSTLDKFNKTHKRSIGSAYDLTTMRLLNNKLVA